MRKSGYLSFSLLAIFVVIAVTPSAFADHMSATVTNAPGSSTPGCETTADGCFIPSMVTLDIGGEVTWENDDTAAHTVTSGTPTEGPDGIFDSSLVMAGSSFSHVFEEAGSYDYFCMVHPWMQGMVMVSAEEMVHDEEMAHGDMEEMAHGDDHAAMGVEDLSDQFVATVTSGVIHHIGGNTDDSTLLVHLFGADDDGELKITLNRDIITPFDDGSYFVLVEGQEVEFMQMGNTIHVDYEAGTERIEIVGSHVVPEFGTIAMIILAVAIISIIAITAKTRTTLIPKF
ncbi:MAG: PEFG-CTERM sorting domain-containing protein [Candidatus Nitrosopelagicus sp.]|nr:PEFG-CTERM sorting domain-containing protein [Candidatus Nitrosopelagicus sp.]